VTQIECELGHRNPPGTQFCRECGAYLWDGPNDGDGAQNDRVPDDRGPSERRRGQTGTGDARRRGGGPGLSGGGRAPVDATVVIKPAADPKDSARPPQVTLKESETVLDPRLGAVIDLEVTNSSSIVEGYRCDALNSPPWLAVGGSSAKLLPDTSGTLRVELKIRGQQLAVAQRLPLRLRVRTDTDGDEYADVVVALRVPEVGGAPEIKVEPVTVRVLDAPGGQFTVLLENRECNHSRRCLLSGSDEEGVVRFTFSPPAIEMPPEGRGSSVGRFTAPAPEPGAVGNRRLTVRAAQGADHVEATVTVIQQSSAADPLVRLHLDPERLSTADRHTATVTVTVDNRTGRKVRKVVLHGRDPEDRIRFTPRSTEAAVPPGGQTRVSFRLDARVPDPDTEVTRQFVVQAVEGGREPTEVSGSWVQKASQASITTATMRLEPEYVRVRDQESGRFSIMVDNARGVWPLRVRFAAADPENAMGYHFHPPVLDVPPRRAARGLLAVSAPLPPYGEKVSRPFRVKARDENGSIEAEGVFEQATTPSPMSTAQIRLDPQQLVTRDAGSGRMRVWLDNRAGSRPLRARLSGVDPQRVIRFRFDPPVVDVAPGQVGGAVVTVAAPRAASGEQAVRPLTIVADDGSSSIQAEGSFAQSSRDIRPIIRLVLTVLGALLVAVGAVLPWLVGDGRNLQPTVGNIINSVNSITAQVSTGPPANASAVGMLLRTAEPMERLATLLMAALMAFGLTGRAGRLTRLTALLVVLTMVAASAFYLVIRFGRIDIGAVLVVLGGIVAYAGGRLVRS
jgi:hypothetical protein